MDCWGQVQKSKEEQAFVFHGIVTAHLVTKTYPNQKPWIDGGSHAKLKARTTAFNHGKVIENMAEYKQCSYSLHKAIKQAKCQYRDKVESQFNDSDTRRMWQGLQTITEYKRKSRHRRLASRQTEHLLRSI